MVDVTDIPDVTNGDEVILLGSQDGKSITAQDIGTATGTINYEIVCAFGQRLPKIYV
jgi:alanine racemase